MNSLWQSLLAVGPLGLYFWVLALWQGCRQPRVVRGLTDFALLAFGLGGLLTFGPAGHLVARVVLHSTEPVDLLTVGSAFGLVAWSLALRSLDRIVVYQVDPGTLIPALEDCLRASGGRFARTLEGFEDREALRGLRVEVSRGGRCAVIEAFGKEPTDLCADLRPRLRQRLVGVHSRPSRLAIPLSIGSVLVLAGPLLSTLISREQARAALRTVIERLGGG